MIKLKTIHFKWNTKYCHCNQKLYLAFLLKHIYLIQFFFFDSFYPLYYHVLLLGHVGVKV